MRNASSSQTKEPKNDIPFLPEDIIFHILICLPAEFLHCCGKFVCKAWAKIISNPSFIKAHLLQSNDGLFVQKFGKLYHSCFLEFNEGEFRTTHLNCHGHMVSSCRGLSLFSGSYPERFLFVGNHVTQKYKNLPFPIAKGHLLLSCHIGYISHIEEYKVVCHCEISGGEYRWFVLSMDNNNMSWRRMETSLKGISFYCDDRASVSVGGAIYYSQMNSHIFVIDLYDETSHSIQVPNEFVGSCYSLLERGNSLSFIVRHSAEVHVCILKTYVVMNGLNFYKITETIDGPNFLCESFIPVGWLDDGQLLAFIHFEKLVVTYNVKTGEARSSDVFSSDLIRKHTNSLVSWKHLEGKDKRGVSST
ncbi:uncharacterized protein LOC114323181 isoform X3 [Camellia sinensis]|uniref:uncharacterized protein LOC114323181 isoform X3 n=1 Tax=Camellia sinensis TaxID=4442 RepID=UPI001036B8AA|nr:uncharacterized protein LOC114323181 isoform X3 [Camellia sinensis]